jgi:molybdenum cofactor cytidylyltransferase
MMIPIDRALRVSNSSCIAFTGAGGKTTALFHLAGALSKGTPVIVTASTHLGAWQVGFADHHFVVDSPKALGDLESQFKGITLVTGEFDEGRTKPLDPESLHRLNQFCKQHAIPMLIEADGSRQKPLKAWAEHEPPIPTFVNQVINVVGLTALGKSLNQENVHRPEIFSKLSVLQVGGIITPDILTKVLTRKEGGLKNIP